MKPKKIIVAALIAAGVIAAGVGKKDEPIPQEYTSYSRVVQKGQTLWDICSKLDSSEDIRDIIARCRMDNSINDPGILQPGTILLIRVKKR